MPVSGLSVMATEGLGCAARAMALCDSNGMSRKTGGSEKSEVRGTRGAHSKRRVSALKTPPPDHPLIGPAPCHSLFVCLFVC